uniref:Uncharacterized protein n=1 Tax=Amphimedon queenslandica TaxID=400682 RepID=A0A1X7TCY9_AMPQE
MSLTPLHQSDEQITIGIYSTPNLGVQYINDKNGKSTVTKIVQLLIDIPNPNNLPREKRLVDVSMNFSGTEIQAKATYRITGKKFRDIDHYSYWSSPIVSKEISDPVIDKEYQEDIELHLTKYDVAEAISSATKLADEGQLESARATPHRCKARIKKSVVFGLPLAKYFEETIDESLKGLASQSHYSGHGKPSMMNYSLSHYQQRSHGAGAGASSISSDRSGASPSRLSSNPYTNAMKSSMKFAYAKVHFDKN